MSTSLALINGDLAIGPGRRFETVSGQSKLSQDLQLWVLEKIGTDSSLPGFGSNLDNFIGEILTLEVENQIRNEMLRLLQQYQSMQYNKIRNETIMYLGKSTLEAGEIISTIDLVDVQSEATLILVQIRLTTLAGTTLKLTLPITNA